MKIGVLAIFFIITLPLVLALSSDIQSSYQPGQTIIVKFTGNFLDNIQKSDVSFMSDRDFLPLTYDLAKINDNYYLYAVLQITPRNYTLKIKNVHYTEQGVEKTQDLVYGFSTLNISVASFSVEPGFVLTTSNISLKITSNTQEINALATFLDMSKNIVVKEGKSQILTLPTDSVKNSTVNFLTITAGDLSYNIPVYTIKKQRVVNTSLSVTSLKFQKSFLNLTVIKKQPFQFELVLINNGQTDLSNLTLTSNSDLLKVEPTKIASLLSEESVTLNLSIKTTTSGIYPVTISVVSPYETEMDISINSVEDIASYNNVSQQNNSAVSLQTCEEKQGTICQLGEVCQGNFMLTSSSDNKVQNCCVGKCVIPSSGGGKWIWIVLIIIILGGGAYFFYRKSQLKQLSPNDFLKKKEKEFSERFSPKTEHVNHKLSKE